MGKTPVVYRKKEQVIDAAENSVTNKVERNRLRAPARSDRCEIKKKCGACQLSNMDYERQLKFKQAAAVKMLKRFGHVEEIIGMETPYNYRCKAQYAVRSSGGKAVTGVYQSSTGGTAVTDSCYLNDELSNRIVKYLRKLVNELKIPPYNPKTGKGVLRHIMIRNSAHTGEYMVVLVCRDDYIKNEEKLVKRLCEKFSEISTVVLNVSKSAKMTLGSRERVLFGSGTIEDILCGKRFRISARSFYQVNPVQTEILYNTAIKFAGLTGSERILDAYCGTGTIGLCAADNVSAIVGAELNSEAVKDARKNAALNGIENAVYYEADSAEYMRKAVRNGEKFDVVFTDPPRAGCSRTFLEALAVCAPQRIVYVSCNPETLARDLGFLVKNGYKVNRIQPVDMFPHTRHIETVVLLTKKQHSKNAAFGDH